MKKVVLITLVYTIFLPFIFSTISQAKGKKIQINERNFPNVSIRMVFSEKIDKNKDGILQRKELDKVKKLKIDGDCKDIDIQGISYLSRLRELEIKARSISSIDDLRKLTKLKKLSLTMSVGGNLRLAYGPKNLEELTINCKYLDKVELWMIEKLKKLSFIKESNLRELEITGSPKIKKLNLDNVIKLKVLTIDGVGLKKLNIQNLSELEKLTAFDCKLIKKIDLRKNEKLKYLFWNYSALQNIKWGEKPNLQYIELIGNPLRKKVDLKKFSALIYVKVSRNKISSY